MRLALRLVKGPRQYWFCCSRAEQGRSLADKELGQPILCDQVVNHPDVIHQVVPTLVLIVVFKEYLPRIALAICTIYCW